MTSPLHTLTVPSIPRPKCSGPLTFQIELLFEQPQLETVGGSEFWILFDDDHGDVPAVAILRVDAALDTIRITGPSFHFEVQRGLVKSLFVVAAPARFSWGAIVVFDELISLVPTARPRVSLGVLSVPFVVMMADLFIRLLLDPGCPRSAKRRRGVHNEVVSVCG